MRVLVVDDEPTAQKVMQLFLARSGYTPIIHSDGSKVLELAQSEDPPPIIVLDWMLPGADGLTICRALRTAKLKSRPYIFMLSSKTNRDDVAAALDAGADDYVTKPFHINELQARLRVAKRTIEYQQELLHQIADNEALHQRNSLLGELISKQQPAAVPAAPVVPPASLVPAPAVVSVPDAAPKPPKTDVLFTTHEIRYLLSATLMELRLVLERVTLRADVIEPKLVNYGAWSAIMLHTKGYWMDLLLLAKGEATGKLFAQSLGRVSTSMGENEVFLAELARVVGLGFTRTLNTRQASAGQPLLSRTLNFSGRTGLPRLPLDTISVRSRDRRAGGSAAGDAQRRCGHPGVAFQPARGGHPRRVVPAAFAHRGAHLQGRGGHDPAFYRKTRGSDGGGAGGLDAGHLPSVAAGEVLPARCPHA